MYSQKVSAQGWCKNQPVEPPFLGNHTLHFGHPMMHILIWGNYRFMRNVLANIYIYICILDELVKDEGHLHIDP